MWNPFQLVDSSLARDGGLDISLNALAAQSILDDSPIGINKYRHRKLFLHMIGEPKIVQNFGVIKSANGAVVPVERLSRRDVLGG